MSGSSRCGVSVNLSQATQDSLTAQKYSLCVFRAVQSNFSGLPLVWARAHNFLNQLDISWTDEYCAYVCRDALAAPQNHSSAYRADIREKTETPISLGQIWHAPDPSAINIWDNKDSIGISANTAYTCGLSQSESADPPALVCALPLTPGQLVRITPTEKLLLAFTVDQYDVGHAVQKLSSTSILVDVAGAAGGVRELAFDLDNGWSPGSGPWPAWARHFDIEQDIAQILVSRPAS